VLPASLTSTWSWKSRALPLPISSAATRPSSAARITSSYSAIRSQLQKSSKKLRSDP